MVHILIGHAFAANPEIAANFGYIMIHQSFDIAHALPERGYGHTESGQPIVIQESDEKFDYTSLASLAAANLAATDGLASLVGEGEFSVLVHQGRNRSLYISDLLRKFSLVLVFNASTTLGLVRYKAKKAIILLEEVIQDVLRRTEKNTPSAASSDFSEEELEKLLEL